MDTEAVFIALVYRKVGKAAGAQYLEADTKELSKHEEPLYQHWGTCYSMHRDPYYTLTVRLRGCSAATSSQD